MKVLTNSLTITFDVAILDALDEAFGPDFLEPSEEHDNEMISDEIEVINKSTDNTEPSSE